jgi:hypothetical protein
MRPKEYKLPSLKVFDNTMKGASIEEDLDKTAATLPALVVWKFIKIHHHQYPDALQIHPWIRAGVQ